MNSSKPFRHRARSIENPFGIHNISAITNAKSKHHSSWKSSNYVQHSIIFIWCDESNLTIAGHDKLNLHNKIIEKWMVIFLQSRCIVHIAWAYGFRACSKHTTEFQYIYINKICIENWNWIQKAHVSLLSYPTNRIEYV